MLKVKNEITSNIEIITDESLYKQNYNGYIIRGSDFQYSSGFSFEELKYLEYVCQIQQIKFTEMLNSAEQALKSFQYQGLTFEMSGESKANLFAVMQDMQVDPSYSTPWLALNGTYKLGEPNLIIINASNVNEFKQAFEQKTGAVFQWQLTTQHLLERATTIEEVEAISTEYPQ